MVTPEDIGLWHDYARQLRSFFPFSNHQPSSQRIYVVPLTSVGISIGKRIDQSIVNHDLFRIGDLLLPPDSPVFIPGPSYSQRLLRYLQAVEVPSGKQDARTEALLEAATTRLANETNFFLTKRREAFEHYSIDPERSSLSFDDWTKLYYPPYEQAQRQKNAASQAASDASKDYYGSQTDQLWADKARVSRAFSEIANPPYNMPTSMAQLRPQDVTGSRQPAVPNGPSSEVSVDTVAGDTKFEPRYNIDAAFGFIANTWVETVYNPVNKPVVIKFHSESSPNESSTDAAWSDVGFDDQLPLFGGEFDALSFMPLFTADRSGKKQADSDSKKLVVGIGDRENTSVTITISATDARVFSISPDEAWNLANAAKQYPKLRADASEDLYEPFVLVTHVLLGYMVSVDIETDSQTFSDIDGGLRDAKAAGRHATLFGLNIGPISNNFTVGYEQVTTNASSRTIQIPSRDSYTLTLLGLMGQKLATPLRRT